MKSTKPFFAFLALQILISISVAAAQTGSMEVLIRTGLEPLKVIGLIISPEGTVVKDDVGLKRTDSGIVVSVGLTKGERKPGSFLTAMANMQDGSIVLADLKPLGVQGIDKSFLSLPTCSDKVGDPDLQKVIALGNLGMLETLIEIRAQRREVSKQMVKEILSPNFVDRLSSLEAGVGLSSDIPLSSDTHPLILTDRLNRLLQALKNIKG